MYIQREEEKPILMALLMAIATSIGLTKMADAITGIAYYQMANAAQWSLCDPCMLKQMVH
ncbi:Tn3 family transposase [Paraliobacillus sp. JSM ZJ581]|uniref:Tn3 family transposase n=1 Tax=Paraliobacillus sp. JSM ZJ581 TaxID=3342118 RepID=UPI0035A908D2